MDGPISHGRPFDLGHLWPTSILFARLDDQGIFTALDTDIEPLKALKEDKAGQFSLCLDLPDLEEQQHDNPQPIPSELGAPLCAHDDEDNQAPDIWDFDLQQSLESATLPDCTWEVFEKKIDPGTDRTAYLSEAGSAAFDAVLRSVEGSAGVLPQDFTLRAMCSLALGRSSTLIHWDHSKDSFVSTLEGATMTGTSLLCSVSLVEYLMALGNMTVRLRTFVASPRASNSCSAATALRSCTAIVLDALEERISSCVGAVRSALQLQQLVAAPGHLLRVLTTMYERTKTLTTDEAVISSLSELVHELAGTEQQFCAVLQTLLARVSGPWLEALSADLGMSIQTVGGCEGLAQDDLAPIVEEDRFAFLNTDDQHLLRVTKHAVGLLRDQCPGHPLLKYGYTSTTGQHTNQSMDHAQAEHMAKQYESHMTQILLEGSSAHETNNEPHAVANPTDNFPDPSQESYISDMETLMSMGPGHGSRTASDKLHDDAMKAVSATPDAAITEHSFEGMHRSPIAHLRLLISTQHKLVTGVLLRQLTRQHGLRQQLEHQRSFQLLGNGTFAARLSKALFDKDVQSAERKRGVIPTADDMGLRVGATKDQRWPPASSELQLSLMGLLNDATKADGGVAIDSAARQSQLSFAIRELPEDEIEQVLDPHSIYALDFLRLQYTTCAPLNSVITPTSLNQYDGVFRYLLKLLRLLHVTTNLPRNTEGIRCEPTPRNTLAFAQQAREFATVLIGHVMTFGIAPPWQTFMAALQSLERNLRAEDDESELGTRVSMDIEGLRQLHESCLDRIRTRLFLKKKQEKLRVAVEDVLVSILRCVTALQTEATSVVDAGDHQAFRAKLLQLISLLAETADKPPKTVNAADAEDLDMIRILLVKLDWNGYYTGAGSVA